MVLPRVCSSVEASVNGTATSQNPSSCIQHSICWNEVLRSRSWWSVCQSYVKVSQKCHIGVVERDASSFKHQNFEFLRQSCSQWTPCSATSHYYIVITTILWMLQWTSSPDKWVLTIPILLTCNNHTFSSSITWTMNIYYCIVLCFIIIKHNRSCFFMY